MALVAQQQVADAAKRAQVGRRQQQRTARLEHPVHLSQREHRIDPQVLEELVEQHRVEGLGRERHRLGLDVAPTHVETQLVDRRREALRRDVDGADLVVEGREGRGHQQRYRPVLQDPGLGREVTADERQVRGEAAAVLAAVARVPVVEGRLVGPDAAGELVEQPQAVPPGAATAPPPSARSRRPSHGSPRSARWRRITSRAAADRSLVEVRIGGLVDRERALEVGAPGCGGVGLGLPGVEDDGRRADDPGSVPGVEAEALDAHVGVEDARRQRQPGPQPQPADHAQQAAPGLDGEPAPGAPVGPAGERIVAAGPEPQGLAGRRARPPARADRRAAAGRDRGGRSPRASGRSDTAAAPACPRSSISRTASTAIVAPKE